MLTLVVLYKIQKVLCVCVCVCVCVSRLVISDFVTPWTMACQAPLSMGIL